MGSDCEAQSFLHSFKVLHICFRINNLSQEDHVQKNAHMLKILDNFKGLHTPIYGSTSKPEDFG